MILFEPGDLVVVKSGYVYGRSQEPRSQYRGTDVITFKEDTIGIVTQIDVQSREADMWHGAFYSQLVHVATLGHHVNVMRSSNYSDSDNARINILMKRKTVRPR